MSTEEEQSIYSIRDEVTEDVDRLMSSLVKLIERSGSDDLTVSFPREWDPKTPWHCATNRAMCALIHRSSK